MRTRLTTPGWESALIALAVAARLLAVVVLQSHHVPNSTYEHGTIAENLLNGRGFSIEVLGADGPTSQQAPIYPFLVAAAYVLGGVATPRSLLLLLMAQAILGGLLTWGSMRLCRKLLPGSRQASLITGLIVAIHPTLVYAATHVQVAGLAATLLVWVLVFAVQTGQNPTPGNAIGLGALFATMVLTDPILGLAAPALAWLIIRESKGWQSSLRAAALAGAVATCLVLPWIARNAAVHGRFVPVKSSFGYAFWQGNCNLSAGTDKVVRDSVTSVLQDRLAENPATLAGYNSALWAARHEAGYIDDIALTPADKRMLSQLPEPDRSRVLFTRALEELKTQPGRYTQLCLARLRAFLLFDETNPKTRSLLYRASHLGLTGLALLGWLMVGHDNRRRLAPTLLIFALLTLFHTLTIVSARFHIPIEPLLALWAGAGVAAVTGGWHSRIPNANRQRANTGPVTV